MWVGLVISATYREAKRVLFNQEVKWYKTERVSQAQANPELIKQAMVESKDHSSLEG